VRHAAGRLEQHQALLRCRPVEAPALQVVGQRLVVEERVVAAQRQLETILPLLRPVAGTGVAAGLRQGRHHVAHEADRVGFLLAAHRHRHGDRSPADREAQLVATIRHGPNEAALGDAHQSRRPLQACQPGHVDLLARLQACRQDELPVIVGVRQGDGRRLHLQPDHLRPRGELLLGRRRRNQAEDRYGCRETARGVHGSSFRVREIERPVQGCALATALPAASGTGTNSLSSLPVCASLKRTTPSKPADATCLPSGRKATA
jgi:hypothetical protein